MSHLCKLQTNDLSSSTYSQVYVYTECTDLIKKLTNLRGQNVSSEADVSLLAGYFMLFKDRFVGIKAGWYILQVAG